MRIGEDNWMSIGATKHEVETPALLIDFDIMEANIDRMARYFNGVRSKLRAHAKTHKSPIIAQKQIEAGAKGICCQKLGEAEAMANRGIRDILITNQVVDLEKIERLVRLARSCSITVLVDNLGVARATSEAARRHGIKQGVMVEIDIRDERCGTRPGKPTVEFVKELAKLEGLELRGLVRYEGLFFEILEFEKRRTGAGSSCLC